MLVHFYFGHIGFATFSSNSPNFTLSSLQLTRLLFDTKKSILNTCIGPYIVKVHVRVDCVTGLKCVSLSRKDGLPIDFGLQTTFHMTYLSCF